MEALNITASNLAHINVRHGFFGRHGGFSLGEFASLNCGPGSEDNKDHVQQNRNLCMNELGAVALVTPHQTHSASALYVGSANDKPVSDALVTKTPGIMIGVLTADCLPVLMYDPAAGVIGAAHAGWRGALGGILEACIGLMVQHHASAENIVVAIGPGLRQPQFEVGEELFDAFVGVHPSATTHFEPGRRSGKRQFDLVGFCANRMVDLGVSPDNIEDTQTCTLKNHENWFSYRYSRKAGESDYGRNLSAIVLA